MSIVIEQATEQVKASAAFHSRADLNTITLIDAKLERLVDWNHLTEPIHLEFRHEAKNAKLSKGSAEIQTEFRFRAKDSSPDGAQAILVECTFQAHYSLTEGYKPTSSETEAFQSGNAIFNAWPFFREFVQTNVSRMGLPIPPVPFLRLIPKRDEETAQTETSKASTPKTRAAKKPKKG